MHHRGTGQDLAFWGGTASAQTLAELKKQLAAKEAEIARLRDEIQPLKSGVYRSQDRVSPYSVAEFEEVWTEGIGFCDNKLRANPRSNFEGSLPCWKALSRPRHYFLVISGSRGIAPCPFRHLRGCPAGATAAVKVPKLVPESLGHGEWLDLMILPPFELVPCGVIL